MRHNHFFLGFALALTLAGVLASPFAGAELHARLNGLAAYDDELDVTWLTDAAFGGSDSWQNHVGRVDGLNAEAYLGFSDWRLASMSVAGGLPVGLATEVVDCSTIWQPLCADNELGYMFFHTLGGRFGESLEGDRVVDDVALTNIQPIYWSGTRSGVTNAWMYHFDLGFGVWSPQSASRHAWVVRDGDVGSPDIDGDGVQDASDNCQLVGNADQRDSNADGFGNACDADLNNDCIVNVVDLGILRSRFFSDDADADSNGDGVVNIIDLGAMRAAFFDAPGPSGTAGLCEP